MSSKPKQPCPTCGREFERLWQHKCSEAPESSQDAKLQQTSARKSENVTNVSSKPKQRCPTCGREFERLSQHKCSEAPESSQDAKLQQTSARKSENVTNMSSKPKQRCPTCGREFERLSQHKCSEAPESSQDARIQQTSARKSENVTNVSSKPKQLCPTCGREFERLWQHKCSEAPESSQDARIQQTSARKSENVTNVSSKPKQRCPTCGREFERLSQHKCSEAPESSQDAKLQQTSARKSENVTNMSSKPKQRCPTCGREFERLSQHKCSEAPESSQDARIQQTSARKSENVTNVSSKPKQLCPTCGREFERLSQHKCSEAPESSQDARIQQTSARKSENVTNVSSKPKQLCPTCGREFERLWQHKCSEAPESSQDARIQQTSARKSENVTNVSSKLKQRCPTCGLEFERLWQHKCSEAPESSQDARIQQTSARKSTSKSGNSASANAKEREICPDCGDDFERLQQHKCSQLSDGPHHTEHHPGPDHRSAQSKVTSAKSSGSCPSSEQICPWCGKTFKRLYQHKCRVVSMPPTSPRPPSASPASSQLPGNQPVIDTNALEQQAERVFEALGLQPSSDPSSETLAFFDDEVKLQKEEKDKALDASRRFKMEVKDWLEGCTKDVKWDTLNAGSSYDGTKVARADEVDYMFFPDLPGDWLRISCDNAPPGFCFLEMTSAVPRDNPRALFLQSVCGDRQKQKLSSKLFREKVFDMMRQAVRDERRAKEDPPVKSGGASFPVLLDAFPSSGGDGRPGLRPVSIDLVPALKLDGFPSVAHSSLQRLPPQDMEDIQKAGFHVVPKECPDRRYDSVKHLLWRFSFSLAEKQLTNFADRRLLVDTGHAQESQASPPTCRKQVLRILKRILELFKGVDNSRTKNPKMLQLREAVNYLKVQGGFRDFKVEKFSTFQVKRKNTIPSRWPKWCTGVMIRTLLWTEFYVTCPGFIHWTTVSRRSRLIHCLTQLMKMMSGRMHVPHFFLPGLDIMAEVPKREREFLYILFHIAKQLF